jgi:SAM-dependent methyltransferase
MVPESVSDQSSILQNLEKRICREWQRSSENHQPIAPSLVIFNQAASPPDLELGEGSNQGLALQLKSGMPTAHLRWGDLPVSRICSGELPLQTSSLGAVFLSHVISNGEEPELAEACRVLQPGGLLLILGLNRYGMRHLTTRSDSGLPGIRPLTVREHLEQFDMNVQIMLAAGFCRRQSPGQMNRGIARLLIPVSDLLLIVARKYEPRLATPVSRRRLRAVRAPSVLAGP